MQGITLSHRAATFFEYVRKRLSVKANQPQEGSGRQRHVVRAGETMEGIASEHFGDERLSNLILTLNRSSVIFDERGIANLVPGTLLQLPAKEEVRLYKDNFLLLRKRSKQSKPKIAVNKQCLAKLSVHTSEPFTAESGQDSSVIQLSESCRIYIGTTGPIGTQFSIKLQAAFFDCYMTIAAYESMMGKSRRLVFQRDGSCAQLDVDLPGDVAKEMAKRDFRKNWQSYYDSYFLSSAGSTSQEHLRPQIIR